MNKLGILFLLVFIGCSPKADMSIFNSKCVYTSNLSTFNYYYILKTKDNLYLVQKIDVVTKLKTRPFWVLSIALDEAQPVSCKKLGVYSK